jgi:aspartate/glutamate racemase
VISIGFLHTSPVHEPTFRALAASVPGCTVGITVVDEQLLEDARRQGPGDPDVVTCLGETLVAMCASGTDLIVCTCSTLGGVAEQVAAVVGVDVMRVDRPMAEAALAIGGRIAVMATVESTLGPTRELLESVARERSGTAVIDMRLVAGAWDHFEVGDIDGYLATIAEVLPTLTADVIVLAQASMARAADLVDKNCPILDSLSSFARWLAAETDTLAWGQAPPSSEPDPT